jgi:hypothetical protein
MIIVEDSIAGPNGNNIGTFYHNAMDSLEYEYCYDRLSMSRDLFRQGIARAIDQEITKRGEFRFVGNGLYLDNAEQLFQTFDRVTGEIVINDGEALEFEINYPDNFIANILPQELTAGTSLEETLIEGFSITIQNVMASGYGIADHRNTQRLAAHPHLNRFSTALAPELITMPPCREELARVVEYALALNQEDYTAESWEYLEKALEFAKSKLVDPGVTQEEIDYAVRMLEDAIAGLTVRVPPERGIVPQPTLQVTSDTEGSGWGTINVLENRYDLFRYRLNFGFPEQELSQNALRSFILEFNSPAFVNTWGTEWETIVRTVQGDVDVSHYFYIVYFEGTASNGLASIQARSSALNNPMFYGEWANLYLELNARVSEGHGYHLVIIYL